MSGYNAEYTAPRDNEELADLPAETPAPIILTNKPEPYKVWEFMGMLSSRYSNDDLIEEQEMGDFSQFDMARLIQTVRNLARLANKDISADDHRLTHIWESASEIADRRGYCDVFDSIMEELGTGYTREMEYCVTVSETIKYDVHVTAPRNATQADIEELIQYETLSDHTEIERDWEVDSYESAE